MTRVVPTTSIGAQVGINARTMVVQVESTAVAELAAVTMMMTVAGSTGMDGILTRSCSSAARVDMRPHQRTATTGPIHTARGSAARMTTTKTKKGKGKTAAYGLEPKYGGVKYFFTVKRIHF